MYYGPIARHLIVEADARRLAGCVRSPITVAQGDDTGFYTWEDYNVKMGDSEPSVVATYHYDGGSPSVVTNSPLVAVLVAPPKLSAFVDHGTPSFFDGIHQFLREIGVEELYLTGG